MASSITVRGGRAVEAALADGTGMGDGAFFGNTRVSAEGLPTGCPSGMHAAASPPNVIKTMPSAILRMFIVSQTP